MNLSQLVQVFADDPGVRLASILVALDFVLGVSASIAARTFRLGWLGDFLRRDVLQKLVPYFAVWTAVRFGGDLELGGIGMIEEGVLLTIVGMLTGSIFNSLRDLGVWKGAPDELAGSDAPPPVP